MSGPSATLNEAPLIDLCTQSADLVHEAFPERLAQEQLSHLCITMCRVLLQMSVKINQTVLTCMWSPHAWLQLHTQGLLKTLAGAACLAGRHR